MCLTSGIDSAMTESLAKFWAKVSLAHKRVARRVAITRLERLCMAWTCFIIVPEFPGEPPPDNIYSYGKAVWTVRTVDFMGYIMVDVFGWAAWGLSRVVLGLFWAYLSHHI